MASRALRTVCAMLAAGFVCAERLPVHSFEPPFTTVDSSGNRLVSKDWKSGAVATVSSNFVRLTPDRQSKKGALWSRKAIGSDTFSTVLKFRISGQGKKFYGDGMALWFIQQAYYVEGDLHGSVERFTGFGVIFDTFKNTETLSYHRDVSLVINDGTKTTEMMMDKVEGCDANIRYHEDRADFTVDSASRAKIVLEKGNKLTVLIDARNEGDFRECASVTLPFNQDWTKRAHIGVTASTGQLADNHDVISLLTFSDQRAAEAYDSDESSSTKFGRGNGVSETRFERLEDAVNQILEKLEYLEHHTEHELLAVEDHIKVTATKLGAQEAISEGRIDELEKKVVLNVNEGVESRLSQLEHALDESLVHRVTAVEKVLNTKISTTVEAVEATVQGLGGGWKGPFMFLLILIVGSGVGLYQWYKYMAKKHHLP